MQLGPSHFFIKTLKLFRFSADFSSLGKPFQGPVYTIPISFHIGLVSYRIRLLFTRYRFHSISDWPPFYTRTHQSDMLHTQSHRINRVHKRALRIMWQDIAAPFAELLARGSECTIHIRNLQKLMLEIYKCLNSENPSFMWNIFQTKDVAYNLRTKNLLQLPSTNTLSYGNDSLSFRGAILWNTLSDSIKSLATSASFKRSIKEWKGDNCSCKICR